jgi:hypothetical protein
MRVRRELLAKVGEFLGQLLVEEQAHGLCDGRPGRAALSFGRVREAGLDVVRCELRKLRHYLGLGHPTGRVTEHVTHRNSRPANTGLAEPDARIDADAVKGTHDDESLCKRAEEGKVTLFHGEVTRECHSKMELGAVGNPRSFKSLANWTKCSRLAERNTLSADFTKTAKQVWRREWEYSIAIPRERMKSMVSRASLATATIWRLLIFAGVFVRLPTFADFSISMALEMAYMDSSH